MYSNCVAWNVPYSSASAFPNSISEIKMCISEKINIVSNIFHPYFIIWLGNNRTFSTSPFEYYFKRLSAIQLLLFCIVEIGHFLDQFLSHSATPCRQRWETPENNIFPCIGRYSQPHSWNFLKSLSKAELIWLFT